MILSLYRFRRPFSFFFIVLMATQLLAPATVYALTSGPTQPEVQAFAPAGTNDLVDLFSGDFSYNIPLLELPGPNGGYPFNLGYQSGVGMDQEASWVGLGWSLNPGAITRQMRGLPDEFKNEDIRTKMSVAPSVTVGLGAGVGLEVFGADKGASLKVGFSISHNTHKGVGYSIDGSIGYGKTGQGMSGGVGLDLSLDNKEGVNVSPSLSLGGKIGEFGLSAAYNSKVGLSSVSLSHEYEFDRVTHTMTNAKTKKTKGYSVSASVSQSSTLSLAHPGYTPQVTMPMRSINISATFKAGGAWWGVFASPYVTGFYNEQWLKHDKKWLTSKAFGYMNYQESGSNTDLFDFNREKDGMVTKESPNLPIPSLSYDIYSVVGQGIAAMYRPMRNDYGWIRDQKLESISRGGSAGVDIGPAAHVGVNVSVNHSKSVSGAWTDNNEMDEHAQFQKGSLGSTYEPWYFKVHGEPYVESAQAFEESFAGEKAVRIPLEGGNSSPVAKRKLAPQSGSAKNAPSNSSINRERKPRNQVIQSFTNEQLLANGKELMSKFKVRYLDQSGTPQEFDRSSLPGHHTTAFTALTPEGMQYNYGIPAYNLKQEEVTFTADESISGGLRTEVKGSGTNGDPYYAYDGTEKFMKRVEMPRFAHSYLLTSITGPDYVDVTDDGVTEDDLGYWVKFVYQKATTDTDRYKWRDPFYAAHFQEGWKTDPRDNKGSFVYGEKELWYLAQAETKSHIVKFKIEAREDGRGVQKQNQDTNLLGARMYALRELVLFTRAGGEANPIKTVTFDYDYSLCPGIDNNAQATGKLTLKKLWFEHGHSERGKLNPYVFKYHDNNPLYNINAIDRWGNYKPAASDPSYNSDFPYVEQNPLKEDDIHSNAAAWSLSEIFLPSGGKIIVDYESDDYAYVQHKQAMQMVEIVDPYKPSNQVSSSGEFNLNDSPKVRFKLEKSIAGTSTIDHRREVLKYLDQKRKQLYFKIKVNLRSASENFHEYISGYADIDMGGAMLLEKDATGNYAYGSFYLKKDKNYHPFSLRTWQHLRTNQPELANSGRKLKQTDSNSERIKQMKSLGSIVAHVRQMFGGYYNFCDKKGWGKELVAGRSWIRLNSPDKIKYGGGLRVRQITMKDQWTQNEEGIYGQVYEYRTTEGGEQISSGVASYEPMAGGDENALRYAKKYTQSIPLRSDNNMFFEYPINETYYPGAQVGYRKVTVMSLASASLAGKDVRNITLSDGKELFPKGEGISYGTTGMTVHEFYTAKEFPVVTEETDKQNKPYKLPLTIPFIGSVSITKLASSQGYSIITNDMHGKPMKVSNYRQDKTGKIEPEPISWVKYNYASAERFYEQEKVSTLLNQFKINDDGTLSLLTASERSNGSIQKYTVGQENEFFMDFREYQDDAWTGGLRYNTEFLFVFIGVIVVPVPWPSITKSTNQLRTAVTNKVIFKSGILESTEAFDGGSLVKTSNLKWDKMTCAPVLTVVNNNFDAPVYTYNIPAYTQYQGMGAAYQNLGLSFTITDLQKDPYDDKAYSFTTSVGPELLVPGDELLLYSKDGELSNPLARVVYTGLIDDRKMLYAPSSLSATGYKCMIVRSGYRNQLSVMAGSVTALEDPSKQGTPVTFEKTIQIPQ
jgi:hypothetical protein